MVETSSRDATDTQAAFVSPAERRCLVTGESKAKSDLIRFVVGPANVVVPDLTLRLPGRGLWVSATREALTRAITKNLFSRAAKTKVTVPPDLLDQVETLLARRCLSLLGLAKGAGAIVTGQPQIEHALSHSGLASILLAADAGRDCRKKLSRAHVTEAGFSRTELGAALGHDHLASVGLKPHALTEKLQKECARWQGVRAKDSDLTDKDTTESSEER
ncbi:MAG: RNA-binding protein [Bdellovibrionales bacterium]